MTPDRALFILLMLAVAARWLRDRTSVLRFGPTEYAMMFFVGMAVISIFIGGGTKLTPLVGGLRADILYLGQGYAMPFAAFFLGKNLLTTDRDLNRLCWLLVILGLGLGVLGVLQQLGAANWLPSTGYEVTNEGRSFGTLTGPIEFGILVSFCGFAALLTLPGTRNKRLRGFLILTTAVTLAGVVSSKTRGVLLGAMVGLAVVARYQAKLRRSLFIVSGLSFMTLAVAWPVLAQTDLVKYRLTQLSPIFNRIALYATALNMSSAYPITGSGFGRYTFATEKWPYITSIDAVPTWYAVDPGVPHNEFLHILVQLGLVGLFAYLVPMWCGFRNASLLYRTRTDLSEPARRVLLLSLAALGIYVANGVMVDLAAFTYASAPFYLLLGLTDGIRIRAQGRRSAQRYSQA